MSIDPLTHDDNNDSTSSNDAFTVVSRRGHLVALSTKAEIENRDVRTIFAYIVEIPQKSASGILRCVDAFC